MNLWWTTQENLILLTKEEEVEFHIWKVQLAYEGEGSARRVFDARL
jgi:hypothetical protein